MRNAARNYIKTSFPNADESEQAQRYFLAPDTFNRYLWARDFNVPKAFDMYIKSVVIPYLHQINAFYSNGIWISNQK